jgi:hypothetical protein
MPWSSSPSLPRAAALAALLFSASTARATVMVSMPLEDMVQGATAIVHARVARVGTRLALDAERGPMPHTVSELVVLEWLKGEGGHQITVDELGGEVAGLGMAIAGTPQYRVGDEVIIFLRTTEEGSWRTLGMVQGQFVVRHGVPGTPDEVIRDTSSVGFATWDGGPMSIVEGGRESAELGAFLAWVRATVAQVGLLPGGTTGALGGER